MPSEVITLTFGDCAENHVGNQQIGHRLPPGSGFTLKDLERIAEAVELLGGSAEIVDLSFEGGPPAAVLVIRRGVDLLLGDDRAQEVYEELAVLEWDTHVLLRRYGKVVNKHARYNLCFDVDAQEPSYEEGKGRIVAIRDVPSLERLVKVMRLVMGRKAEDLKIEGNRYYDVSKTGIGFHGDTERSKVIAARFGTDVDMPIVYRWYHLGHPVGDPISISLRAGDMYVMSEKAVGNDWKSPSKYTLRHATGCKKFVDPPPKRPKKAKAT
jgi:hypothetical protein